MPTNPFLEAPSFDLIEVADRRFEIRECQPDAHKALFARANFAAGSPVADFRADETRTRPNRYTVQTGEGEHIVLMPEFLLYINHHCRPNCFFDLRSKQLRALTAIRAGDELTFFYPSMEWSMAEPFDCHCGAARCLGRIQGAAYLDDQTLAGYQLSEHIKDLLWLRRLESGR